jgi:hypothetical protein
VVIYNNVRGYALFSLSRSVDVKIDVAVFRVRVFASSPYTFYVSANRIKVL